MQQKLTCRVIGICTCMNACTSASGIFWRICKGQEFRKGCVHALPPQSLHYISKQTSSLAQADYVASSFRYLTLLMVQHKNNRAKSKIVNARWHNCHTSIGTTSASASTVAGASVCILMNVCHQHLKVLCIYAALALSGITRSTSLAKHRLLCLPQALTCGWPTGTLRRGLPPTLPPSVHDSVSVPYELSGKKAAEAGRLPFCGDPCPDRTQCGSAS